jgi:hypothetical protein
VRVGLRFSPVNWKGDIAAHSVIWWELFFSPHVVGHCLSPWKYLNTNTFSTLGHYATHGSLGIVSALDRWALFQPWGIMPALDRWALFQPWIAGHFFSPGALLQPWNAGQEHFFSLQYTNLYTVYNTLYAACSTHSVSGIIPAHHIFCPLVKA